MHFAGGTCAGTQCVSAETRLEMLQRKLQGGGALSVQELRRKEQEFLSLATIEVGEGEGES